ncbi:hypothetical protein HBH69_086440 [Parastagonospora nodorum]|nr:hypothetical protein HBI09_077000 [Parastagonospora nodorum]KAH5015706.1 hypothetical protein HBI77_060830 [Parastagonospora nodorum]KAH5157097.1 hypothetical protein HBH69_086440 [Parastagonospora nodorum]KAH5518156.1 hypothetical protein HBI52_094570 [Parastagonospora nodorum]
MHEQTKTFIARVGEYFSLAESPALASTLEATIDGLKKPSCSTPVDSDPVTLIGYLFNITLIIPGPPSDSDDEDDTLSKIITGLKEVENSAVKHALYNVLVDLEILVWDEKDECWGVIWEHITCWMVALLGIVEGWGVSYADLMSIVSKFPEDPVYEIGLREAVMQAYEVLARMKEKGESLTVLLIKDSREV